MNKDELKKYLIKCCYWYYNQCNPLISDYEFDMKFKELQTLEEIDGADKDSPTQMIYGERGEQYLDWAKEK
jgi:NAD-dependent DNA ligase